MNELVTRDNTHLSRPTKGAEGTSQLEEGQNVTEFESLDMAVHMLFLAGGHSYEIARAIARAAKAKGLDGLIYPSYFSMLRTGATPFETVFGISHRRVSHFREREKSKIIRNLALFGRPIEEGSIRVKCIDRLILSRVKYRVHFGPVGCKPIHQRRLRSRPRSASIKLGP